MMREDEPREGARDSSSHVKEGFCLDINQDLINDKHDARAMHEDKGNVNSTRSPGTKLNVSSRSRTKVGPQHQVSDSNFMVGCAPIK